MIFHGINWSENTQYFITKEPLLWTYEESIEVGERVNVSFERSVEKQYEVLSVYKVDNEFHFVLLSN